MREVLKPEIITALLALLGGLLQAFAGNHGGLAMAFLLIAVLGWRLYICERKHQDVQTAKAELLASNAKLTGAVIILHGIATHLAGGQRRRAHIPTLDELLSGKPEVVEQYKAHAETSPRRRR